MTPALDVDTSHIRLHTSKTTVYTPSHHTSPVYRPWHLLSIYANHTGVMLSSGYTSNTIGYIFITTCHINYHQLTPKFRPWHQISSKTQATNSSNRLHLHSSHGTRLQARPKATHPTFRLHVHYNQDIISKARSGATHPTIRVPLHSGQDTSP